MLKKERVKKGYILIYALLLGNICILTAAFLLKWQGNILQNTSSEINCLKKDSSIQRQREVLLSNIDKSLYDNLESISEEKLNICIDELYKDYKWYCEDSYAYFDENKNIIIEFCKNLKVYKKERYSINVLNSNLKYKREY